MPKVKEKACPKCGNDLVEDDDPMVRNELPTGHAEYSCIYGCGFRQEYGLNGKAIGSPATLKAEKKSRTSPPVPATPPRKASPPSSSEKEIVSSLPPSSHSEDGRGKRYEKPFIKEAVEFSVSHSPGEACRKFDLKSNTLSYWRKKYSPEAVRAKKPVKVEPEIVPPVEFFQRNYSTEFKREVTDYSVTNTVKEAAEKYGVDKKRISVWRKKYTPEAVHSWVKKPTTEEISETPQEAIIVIADRLTRLFFFGFGEMMKAGIKRIL